MYCECCRCGKTAPRGSGFGQQLSFAQQLNGAIRIWGGYAPAVWLLVHQQWL
jgi:hypothetical protein